MRRALAGPIMAQFTSMRTICRIAMGADLQSPDTIELAVRLLCTGIDRRLPSVRVEQLGVILVRAPRGRAPAPCLFVASTATFSPDANNRPRGSTQSGFECHRREGPRDLSPTTFISAKHRELAFTSYDTHDDGRRGLLIPRAPDRSSTLRLPRGKKKTTRSTTSTTRISSTGSKTEYRLRR